jgi:hypothetical protein
MRENLKLIDAFLEYENATKTYQWGDISHVLVSLTPHSFRMRESRYFVADEDKLPMVLYMRLYLPSCSSRTSWRRFHKVERILLNTGHL